MPQEAYADPITNDEPKFHSMIPVSELIECVTRAQAIEAIDISSTLLAMETTGGATIIKMSRPSIGPLLCMGAQGKMDSQGDRMRGHSTTTD